MKNKQSCTKSPYQIDGRPLFVNLQQKHLTNKKSTASMWMNGSYLAKSMQITYTMTASTIWRQLNKKCSH